MGDGQPRCRQMIEAALETAVDSLMATIRTDVHQSHGGLRLHALGRAHRAGARAAALPVRTPPHREQPRRNRARVNGQRSALVTMQDGAGLQTVLQEAVKLKQAQLKNRPERRAWEEAPPFFQWTCGRYDDVQNARSSGTFGARVDAARQLRSDGNTAFRSGRFEDALLSYTKAIAVFTWFEHKDGRSTEDVSLVDATRGLCEDDRAAAVEHLAASFTNVATVLLRRGELEHAVYACNKAILFKPSSAKGFHRRGEAQYAMGTSIHLESAVRDIQIAAKLAPRDTTLQRLLTSWRRELAAQNDKDRKTFGNAFKRGSLYADEEGGDAREGSALRSLEQNGTGWMAPPYTEEAKRQAHELGLDLDDPTVQQALHELHRKKRGKLATIAENGDPGYPATYLQWWQQLLAGKLKWRWHYLAYVALGLHAFWRTYKILAQSAAFSRATRSGAGVDVDDFEP